MSTSTLHGSGDPTTSAIARSWLEHPAVRAARELVLVGALFLLYKTGRSLIENQEGVARRHAVQVHDLESTLRLPSEAGLQHAVAAVPHFFEIANRYYVWVHFPLAITFLVWGFKVCSRADYTWARNLLVTQTFLALIIHIAFPLAPPRMFPQWGFTDTMTRWGPSAYDGASAAVANQYAAMPSLHIGWALLIAVVVRRTGPRWLGAVAWVHAAVTVLVVVTTANHWWLDGVVAALLLAVALLIFPGPKPHVGRADAAADLERFAPAAVPAVATRTEAIALR